jgi:hypothetical protein
MCPTQKQLDQCYQKRDSLIEEFDENATPSEDEIHDFADITPSECDASCKSSDTSISRYSECTQEPPSGYDTSCECLDTTVSRYSECTPEPTLFTQVAANVQVISRFLLNTFIYMSTLVF